VWNWGCRSRDKFCWTWSIVSCVDCHDKQLNKTAPPQHQCNRTPANELLRIRHDAFQLASGVLPGFSDNRHMKVERLSAPRTGRLYPPGMTLIRMRSETCHWQQVTRQSAHKHSRGFTSFPVPRNETPDSHIYSWNELEIAEEDIRA
jgi:hypothetical protein